MMLIVTTRRAMGRVRISRAQAIGGWAATATMAAATLIFFASLIAG
jgi:Mn2+/Fe2+ NRAMP family transporter